MNFGGLVRDVFGSGKVAEDWSCFGEGELLEGFVGVRKAEGGEWLAAGLRW